MMVRTLLFFALLSALGFPTARGQSADTWQQRVRYEMDVTLHPDRHRMEGKQRLTYLNNSPDTLHRVFYHLYYNAFNPNSMMARRNRELPDPDARIVPRLYNLKPEEIGYHRILSLRQEGMPLAYREHDTILQVDLARPILPGDSTVLDLRFESQMPLLTRRGGRDSREGVAFSMSQWYPKIAAYDERGWHADPYVGREFYAPFGTFDVTLRLPSPYIVGATGVLLNGDEIGYGYETPGRAAPVHLPTDTLFWRFHAENVHDFAWSADPEYTHDRIAGPNGTTVHLVYQQADSAIWRPLREYVPRLLEAFTAVFGPYRYPQFTVAQAGDGGMEYPMIVFITGRSAGALRSITNHEAAHEWFYAMVGTNETDYAWMDEGFTSFASGAAQAYLAGKEPGSSSGTLLNIVNAQERGIFEPLSTPSDWFSTNAAYGTAAYSGGVMVASMLGYVVSDSVRNRIFREYIRQYTFRQPDPYDLERVAEQVSGLRLDWFFDQLTRTTHTLDYAVEAFSSRRQPDGDWKTHVRLRRNDPLVMPVDLAIDLEGGGRQWVTIPINEMLGHKPTPAGWIVGAPWAWTSSSYELEVNLPVRALGARIDPDGRLPDINRLNNNARFPVQAHLFEPPRSQWFRYDVGYRPLVGYASGYGAAVGLRARGQYLNGRYPVTATLKLWPAALYAADRRWWEGIDYDLGYATRTDPIAGRPAFGFLARKHLGVLENRVYAAWALGRSIRPAVQRSVTIALLHQFATGERTFSAGGGAFFPHKNTASALLTYDAGRGPHRFRFEMETGGSLRRSDFFQESWAAHRLTAEGTAAASRAGLDASLRMKVGLASPDLLPQKLFAPGYGSLEEQWRNAAFRTAAGVFARPVQEAHLVAFGSPGPIAYGLERPVIGTRIAALTAEVGGKPLPDSPWLRSLSTGVFVGAAHVEGGGYEPRRDLADAGLRVSYDVATLSRLDRWIRQSDVLAGLHLSARFPIWVSNPGRAGSSEPFAFRWLIGIDVR